MNLCQCTGCKNTSMAAVMGRSRPRTGTAASVLDAVWLSLQCYGAYLMKEGTDGGRSAKDSVNTDSPVEDLLGRLGR